MEKDRNMTTYHCRLYPKTKKALLEQAGAELRTANKIVEDAIYIYLALDKDMRTEFVKKGKSVAKNFFS